MKKNVEKLDELEEALKNAQEELIVSENSTALLRF